MSLVKTRVNTILALCAIVSLVSCSQTEDAQNTLPMQEQTFSAPVQMQIAEDQRSLPEPQGTEVKSISVAAKVTQPNANYIINDDSETKTLSSESVEPLNQLAD